MGETFQNLRAQGKSVVLERQENIVIERSETSFIKRKHTITREKFRNDANFATSPRRQDTTKHNNSNSGQQQKNIEPLIPLAKTSGKPNILSKRSEVSLELAVLKKEIDDEIDKLKAIRRFTLQKKVYAKKNNKKNNNNNMEKQQQNSAQQNDRTWEQSYNEQTPTNIKYTFEKYSSEHRMKTSASATTHSLYHRDEQTSCRPRMRTIGLQKNTQRSASVCGKKDPIFQNSVLNLKLNSMDSTIPVTATTYCFDYAPECNIGDFYKNNENQQCNNNNHNNCCQKYCQRVQCNSKNKNGVICNQNTYSEKGKTPCTEYKYCCDEIYYNYLPCCQQQQSKQPAMICCKQPTRNAATCCCQHSSANNIRQQYNRRNSDLCTDEFYHKTFKCDERLIKCEDSKPPQPRTKEKHSTSNKKMGRALNERQRAHEKAAQDRKKRATMRQEDKRILTTTSEEEHAAKMAELLLMGERSKQKSRLTKIEICRLRQLLASTEDDGECDSLMMDEDTKRMMEKMRIKDYKPTKPKPDNKEELDVGRFFDEEIAKLGTAELAKQDPQKEKQYEEYIDQYDSKPLKDLNQELLEEQQKTVDINDSKDGSIVQGDVSLSKTYTRLTQEQAQQTDINDELMKATQKLSPSQSRRSFSIERKFSYPEEVVGGKIIPRYIPLENGSKKSPFSTMSPHGGEVRSSSYKKEDDTIVQMPYSSDESKKLSMTPKDTKRSTTRSLEIDDKTIDHIVSHISPSSDFIDTSRDQEETSSYLQDRSGRAADYYNRDIRKINIKQMVQPVDEKSFSRSSRDYYPSPIQQKCQFECDRQYQVCQNNCAQETRQRTTDLANDGRGFNQVTKRLQQTDSCGCTNRTSLSWDKCRTQQTTRRSQSMDGLCEVPEFNGCPCMFDMYLNLIAYLEVGKEQSRDFCSKRPKSQL